MPKVAVLGTFDTKGEEHAFLAEKIQSAGVETLLIDVGILKPGPGSVDVSADQVAMAGGEPLESLRKRNDRNHAVNVMARGATRLLKELSATGKIQGAVALGGGSGTTLAAEAFQALAVGVPKLIVSTIAAGDMRPIVRGTDLTLMYPVLDIAGLNPISRRIIANAAAAIAGMTAAALTQEPVGSDAPLVAITAFGVTTPAVNVARQYLEKQGFSVLVFHATGSGGESLEALVRAGFIEGVLDLTTTELADDLVGGVMSAGPTRLTAAGEAEVPQVVSVGAMDMVNLGPLATIREEFRNRQLFEHNATMVLMRTSPEENAELGKRIADKLNRAKGPTAVMLPLKGVSSIDTEGAPFYDPTADAALFAAIRQGVSKTVHLIERNVDINDQDFALEAATTLVDLIAHARKRSART